MNEPKRRGRPPKAKLLQPSEPRVEGADCVECGQAVGHYDDCSVGMGAMPKREMLDIEADIDTFDRAPYVSVSTAQAYALRVWNGQSVNIPRNERLKRVKAALDGQNLSMEGVVLP
jgi:hypothetical protein